MCALCILFVHIIRVLNGLKSDYGDHSDLFSSLNIYSISTHADYVIDDLDGSSFRHSAL